MKRLFLLPLLLLSASVLHAAPSPEAPAALRRALEQAHEKKLAKSPAWQALLHMHRDILFRWRSSIDDRDFFFDRHGQTDADAELDATITAFVNQDVVEGEAAACRYPARYAFLSHELDLPPAPACERFESWKEKLAPTAASLVFSSYYMNNPASIYGHTFLKLSRAGYEASGPLLDYTVNYAATTNTKNGVLFAIRGLMGGYRGRFSTEPYYVKIQQYNNMESRDLWEYRLNLDQAQLDRLVQHLWELGGTGMTYYFFNKNCSYQLLPLLEVADPELHLARHFRFRAIPLDTLKTVLETPGLVTDTHLRPSHVRAMMARRKLMSEPEIRLAEQMVVDASSKPVDALAPLAPERRALVLDSSFDFLRYKSGFYRRQPVEVQERERRILDLRREIPKGTPILTPDFRDAAGPQSGHDTGRFGFFAGGDRHAPFQEVSVRASIHDLEADPTGYIEGSQLEMFHVRARYQEGPELYLEEFKLFEIVSLAPHDRWVHPPSWTVRANAAVAHDLNKDPDDSLVYGLDGGSGFSWKAGGDRAKIIAYAMWKADFEAGRALQKGHRAGLGGTTGLLGRVGRRFRVRLDATVTRFVTGDAGDRVELSFIPAVNLTRNVEARGALRRSNGHGEASAGLNLYW